VADEQGATAQTQDRRRYPRLIVSGDIAVLVPGVHPATPISGKLLNVSLTGVSFEPATQHALQLGDSATFVWTPNPAVGYTRKPRAYKLTGQVVRITPDGLLGIRFHKLIPEQIQRVDTRPQRMAAVVMAGVLALLITLLKIHNVVYYWWAPMVNTYSILVCTYIFARVAISMFYREPADWGFTPGVSVIVCAKNEEHHIRETVEHIFSSRYPAEQMEVLVIDDGSTDRTWEVLTGLSGRYPRLRLFRHEINKGKRYAMALGAQEARQEILVYIDSDSLVDAEGIYRMVQPFHDKAVGAVAGEISVMVEKDNFFSKMEIVRYQISQRVIKASESLFNAVTCCSGPLAAYRRVSVLRVLPAWLNQTFAGERTTFGDDRSLTNFILRTHRVVFHHGAICRTYVPRHWKTFFRQQLRWKKSWAREAMIACTFMWRKHPMAAVPFYLGILVTLCSPLVALRALFYLPVFLSVSSFPYIFGLALINFLLASVFFYYTRSRYWPYLLAFVTLYILALSWQTYYAIVTIPRSHWGTR